MGEVQEQSGTHPDAVEGSGDTGGTVRGPAEVESEQKFDAQKLRRSFGFAWAGVARTWRTEQNFRVEVAAGVLALMLALLLRADLVPIVLCCLVVLSLETMNSALEVTLNLVSPEFHPLAKRAKDAAAGAVLLASVGSIVVGLLVLGPPLWAWLFGGV